MQLNEAGLSLIKTFEGCKLTVYADQRGLLTVGWGHRTSLPLDTPITQEQADQWLKDDLQPICHMLFSQSKVPLTDNQFSALVSLAYNVGPTAFLQSSLRGLLNQKRYAEAADQFLVWDHCNGAVDPGLLRRREAERALFLAV